MQRALDVEAPRVSLWLTGLKETVGQLGDFVRLAHDMDVAEVYLQRLVYFPEGQGMARPDQALFAGNDDAEGALIRAAEELARQLGIAFNASGATDPAASLKPGETAQPWSLCRRPWTLMYITAHGRALPCCIAPFSMRGYDAFTLGDATHADAAGNLERRALPGFSRGAVERPPACRLRRLRSALEPLMPGPRPRVAAIIPTLDEQDAIGGVIAAIPSGAVDRVIVVDSGSSDGTVARARAAGAERHYREPPRLRARLPGRRRGRRRLRDPRVSRWRRQRLPGGDPASCGAGRRGPRGFRDRLACSRRRARRAA